MTTWAVSLVRASSLAVVAGRSGLDWDVAMPTVVLVTVEAPAVKRTVLVPGSGCVHGEGTGNYHKTPFVLWSPCTRNVDMTVTVTMTNDDDINNIDNDNYNSDKGIQD